MNIVEVYITDCPDCDNGGVASAVQEIGQDGFEYWEPEPCMYCHQVSNSKFNNPIRNIGDVYGTVDLGDENG